MSKTCPFKPDVVDGPKRALCTQECQLYMPFGENKGHCAIVAIAQHISGVMESIDDGASEIADAVAQH